MKVFINPKPRFIKKTASRIYLYCETSDKIVKGVRKEVQFTDLKVFYIILSHYDFNGNFINYLFNETNFYRQKTILF